MMSFAHFIDESPSKQTDVTSLANMTTNQLIGMVRAMQTSDDLEEKADWLANITVANFVMTLLVLGTIENDQAIINNARRMTQMFHK